MGLSGGGSKKKREREGALKSAIIKQGEGKKIWTEQPPPAPNYDAASEANYCGLIISGFCEKGERQKA